MEGEEGKGRVCVTGGTGYLGSWLVMRLLKDGYFVHTTIRSNPAGSKRDLSYLTSLPEASTRLKIFEADLNDPQSFEPAINCCKGVFHVADPMDLFNKEPEEVITQRSINAINGILKACLNSHTVKRVVYTSSTAALAFNAKGLEIVDEESWSDIDFARENFKSYGSNYIISKTLTEKAALEFAEKNKIEVISVIPTFIQGPFITPTCPNSLYQTMPMIFGDQTYLSNFPLVHVDDVANAQIHLFEYPNAKGRYLVSAYEAAVDQMNEILSTKYPEVKVIKSESTEQAVGAKTSALSSKKLLETGFEYKYGFEETFDGAIQSCKEKGIF